MSYATHVCAHGYLFTNRRSNTFDRLGERKRKENTRTGAHVYHLHGTVSIQCRIIMCIIQASNQPTVCAGLTACQLHRHKALQARHQHGIVALATRSRQSEMAPDLSTAADGRSQVPYFVDGQLSLWSFSFLSFFSLYPYCTGL